MGKWVDGYRVDGYRVDGYRVDGYRVDGYRINGTFNAFLNVYVTQRFTERYGGG
jgi:hypothetical protein